MQGHSENEWTRLIRLFSRINSCPEESAHQCLTRSEISHQGSRNFLESRRTA